MRQLAPFSRMRVTEHIFHSKCTHTTGNHQNYELPGGGSVMERVRGLRWELRPFRFARGSGNVRGPSLSCRYDAMG